MICCAPNDGCSGSACHRRGRILQSERVSGAGVFSRVRDHAHTTSNHTLEVEQRPETLEGSPDPLVARRPMPAGRLDGECRPFALTPPACTISTSAHSPTATIAKVEGANRLAEVAEW